MKKPTLHDVAAKAGVHISTASRALNAETRNRVNTTTAKRVLRAAQSLGYQPNLMARGLRTSRTHSVGMIIPDLTNPIFPPIVRGAEDVLAGSEYALLLSNTDYDAIREERAFAALSRLVDGLIIASAHREHPLTLAAVRDGVPVVLVNGLVDNAEVPAVVPDYGSGVAQIVDHLTKLGHTSIAYLSGPLVMSPSVTRLAALREAMRQHGLTIDPALMAIVDSWNKDEGAAALLKMLDHGPPFTAVIANSDLLALGCYAAIAERGLSCPEDISITGFHDIPLVSNLDPPLTTVRVPRRALGAEAANLLLEAMQTRSRHPKVLTLPVELVVRGSTAQVSK
jgi:LacI family transcriptional regulator